MTAMDEATLQAHAARLGDRDALEAWVRASYREVWRLCAALVDEQAAEDLAQETFVRATRALGGFAALLRAHLGAGDRPPRAAWTSCARAAGAAGATR